MYRIDIEDLEFDTIIGILDFEREKKQRVIVNAQIFYKDKTNFINYVDIVSFIKSKMIEKKYLLIEDALDSLIFSIKKQYSNILKIKLKIVKPDILPNCKVSVTRLKKF